MRVFCIILLVLLLIFFGGFAIIIDEFYSLKNYCNNLEYRYNNLKEDLKHTRANVRYEYNCGWRDGYRIATTNNKEVRKIES